MSAIKCNIYIILMLLTSLSNAQTAQIGRNQPQQQSSLTTTTSSEKLFASVDENGNIDLTSQSNVEFMNGDDRPKASERVNATEKAEVLQISHHHDDSNNNQPTINTAPDLKQSLLSSLQSSVGEFSDNEVKRNETGLSSADKNKSTIKKKILRNFNETSTEQKNDFETFISERESLQKMPKHLGLFDFNLDDLEDLQENFKNRKYEKLLTESETLPLNTGFDQYPLQDDETDSDGDSKPIAIDRNHIYKVANSKGNPQHSNDVMQERRPETGIKPSLNDRISGTSLKVNDAFQSQLSTMADLHKFQLLTNLFNHNFWHIESILKKVTSDCGHDMKEYLNDLSLARPWALKVSDASGRYRGQFLFGNVFWMGSKPFCDEINYEYFLSNSLNNSVSVRTNNRKIIKMGFTVAKIMTEMRPMLPRAKFIQVGQCLPQSCSVSDVEILLKLDPAFKLYKDQSGNSTTSATSSLSSGSNISHYDLTVLMVRKVPGDYVLWQDRKFRALCLILASVVTLILIASIYEANLEGRGELGTQSTLNDTKIESIKGKTHPEFDSRKNFELYQMNSENNNGDVESDAMKTKNEESSHKVQKKSPDALVSKLLLCFAIGSNCKAILSLETQATDSLTCIHGMRLLSVLWTIMVHTYLQLFAIGENRYTRKITERSFAYQLIGNASFSVDTFFFISGLLVTLLYLRKTKKSVSHEGSGKFFLKYSSETLLMIIYRYLRLTPTYFFVIVANELSLRFIYNRAVFAPGIVDHITCQKYWWRNVLYINNWYPFQELCMIWSWYLANDMQFYIMSILILVLSSKFFKTSVSIILSFLFSSWIIAALLSLHHGYMHKVADPFESFDFLYDKPWQRIGPYIMGMITGYILFRIPTRPKVSLMFNILLWLLSLGILFMLVFGVWNGVLSVPATAIYVSLGHTAWGFALIWIILSCYWGMASPMNNILSYRAVIPLSRLTYCTYLVHPVVMVVTSYLMEAPIHLQHALVLTAFLGNAVISFILAFIISLIFEAPLIRLLKVLLKK